MDIITKSTNISIDKVATKYQVERDAKYADITEIKDLFGMLYLLGVIKSERQPLEDLWKKDGTGLVPYIAQ